MKKIFGLLKKWLIHPVKRRIAKCYLEILRKAFGLKVIGITGSAGKTTAKEMIYSILKQRGKTIASYANIDPVYNIPTTILKCSFNTKYLILEMGVEYPGEMDFYLWLAKPDISVILNIYETHTQFFGNARGVFLEKRKIIEKSNCSLAVVNKEDLYLRKLKPMNRQKFIWFGNGSKLYAGNIRIDVLGTYFTLHSDKATFYVQFPIVGRQFISSALAAAAVGLSLGYSVKDIQNGLRSFNSQNHRMKIFKLENGATILDDSYNNNPRAARETINTFLEVFPDKKKIIVFGDMLELGRLEEKSHAEIGKLLSDVQLEKLICVGKVSKITADEAEKNMGDRKVAFFSNIDGVAGLIRSLLDRKTAVLIKGSRSIGLDKLVNALLV